MLVPPLPQEEFEAIFARVPRLTVELVISSTKGRLLSLRDGGPCHGLWHLPGGTVRYGEALVDAAVRIGTDELGLKIEVGELLGYIEYPSHLEQGIDWPVGIAFSSSLLNDPGAALGDHCRWFMELPPAMHEEQRDFLENLPL
ncbi:MAG: NUDIX domain-containing protein [Actinomycetota bacterium]